MSKYIVHLPMLKDMFEDELLRDEAARHVFANSLEAEGLQAVSEPEIRYSANLLYDEERDPAFGLVRVSAEVQSL